MFYETTLEGSIKVSTEKLKNYLYPSFTSEKRTSLAIEALNNELSSFYHKSCGTYVGIKDVTVKTIGGDPEGYDLLKVTLLATVYFYLVEPKEIIDFQISKITPTHVEGVLYNSLVEIPKDQLSTLNPTYSHANNTFELGEKEKIKELDFLRAKVTSIPISSHKDYKTPFYKIKASCRNLGTGKIAFKIS